MGFGPGELSIGEACVTFKGVAWDTRLVFRDWQVIWQPATGTIVLADNTGELLVLKNGDKLNARRLCGVGRGHDRRACRSAVAGAART